MVPLFSSHAVSFVPKEAAAFDDGPDTATFPSFDRSTFEAPASDSSFDSNFDDEVDEAQQNKVAWPQATPASGDFDEAARLDTDRFDRFDRSSEDDDFGDD